MTPADIERIAAELREAVRLMDEIRRAAQLAMERGDRDRIEQAIQIMRARG